MTDVDDTELFRFLCAGLAEPGGARVAFEGSRFGMTAETVAGGAPRDTGAIIHLAFSESDFRRAVAAEEGWASSLWSDRPPLRRAVQLMLVHCDEELATIGIPAAAFVMTFGDDGYVSIEPAPPVDEADADRRRRWIEDKAKEDARIERLIAEGKRAGSTFEWR